MSLGLELYMTATVHQWYVCFVGETVYGKYVCLWGIRDMLCSESMEFNVTALICVYEEQQAAWYMVTR